MSNPVNIYGRRGGRGWRPWVLLPKVLAVGVLLGGLVAAAILIFTSNPQGATAWRDWERQITHLYHYAIIPAAATAVMCGILLLGMHELGLPGVMLRQRWVQVKLLLAGPSVLMLHLASRTLLHDLRRDINNGLVRPQEHLETLGVVTLLGIGLVVGVIVLGRLKPGLGQNWAKDYPRAGLPADPVKCSPIKEDLP